MNRRRFLLSVGLVLPTLSLLPSPLRAAIEQRSPRIIPKGTGCLYVSLHEHDPDASGTQDTHEVNYTSYARIRVAPDLPRLQRVPVTFPAGTGGQSVARYFALGFADRGPGKLLISGPLVPEMVLGNGVTPQVCRIYVDGVINLAEELGS